MIMTGKGQTIITNDGNTMLKDMAVMHPAAKMLVDLSAAQDVEAGDGTTSVVVIAGSLLGAADRLLAKGIHPTVISESFQRAAAAAVDTLEKMSHPIQLSDRATLLQAASTSLSSKIVSQHSNLLGPMAVDAVLKTIDQKTADNVDLKNIRIVKKVGGTIEDSEMIDGLVLNQPVVKSGGGPARMEKARMALIQFQLSPPKPDMENQIVVNDYRQMDKILKEERTYLLNMVKKIKKAKCNVLLIQKSILRDAVNDLSLHFLAKLNILCVKDVERDEVEFICKVQIYWILMKKLPPNNRTVHRLQTNRRHRLLYRRQTRHRRPPRRNPSLRLPHRENNGHLPQINRRSQNRLHNLSRRQQPNPRRSRALPPRRPLRDPVSSKEKGPNRRRRSARNRYC